MSFNNTHDPKRICPTCRSANPPETRFCGACGTHLETGVKPRADSDPLIGTLVGNRFVVIEKIATGGMGVVYRAEQTGIWRPVALKVLRPRYSQDRALHERFRIEASTASKLSHPNTITIYDFGLMDDGGLYIAMEMLEGINLDTAISRGGALKWRRACRIAVQIGASLQEAHEFDIIHRDLKPENIMLTKRGIENDVVKVLDFGIAKIMKQQGGASMPALTSGNELFGTPEYMSPEQIRGDRLDARSDIYSLGVILYRMLSGIQPFDAVTPIAVLTKHLTQLPPPLSAPKGNPPIPSELMLMIMSCLAKEPDERPSSMRDIALQLLGILDETIPIALIPPPPRKSVDTPAEIPYPASAPATPAPQDMTPTPKASPLNDAVPRGVVVPTVLDVPENEIADALDDEWTDDYLDGPPEEEATVSPHPIDATSRREATVSALRQSLRQRKDFPAISENVLELTSKSRRRDISARTLANIILKDYALTTKLLRLVNSPFYGQYQGRITTVSRAVVIMGFEQVRELTFGLTMFDKLEEIDPKHTIALRDQAFESLMSGLLAKKMAESTSGVNPEEVLICAMFHRLGKYIATFYFRDKSREIRRLVVKSKLSEHDAALRVLGVTYPDLGKILVREWDLPGQIGESMTPLKQGPLPRATTATEKAHQLVGFADELVELSQTGHPANRKNALKALARRFSNTIHTSDEQIGNLMLQATKEVQEYTKLMSINHKEGRFIGKLLHWTGITDAPVQDEDERFSDIREVGSATDHSAAKAHQNTIEALSRNKQIFIQGIEEISITMTGHYDLNSVIQMILETMYRGLELSRVLFFLHDIKSGVMEARSGFGDGIEELLGRYKFQLQPGRDLFNQAVLRGKDIVINDTAKPRVMERIPDWYRGTTSAKALLLYPIMLRNVAAGLLYGDILEPPHRISRGLLLHMNELRNLAARGIREKGAIA